MAEPEPCSQPCDHCRPDEWHGCARPKGHGGYHSCGATRRTTMAEPMTPGWTAPDQAQARIDAALAIHGRVPGAKWCGACGRNYPCPTVLALRGESVED